MRYLAALLLIALFLASLALLQGCACVALLGGTCTTNKGEPCPAEEQPAPPPEAPTPATK